MVVANVTAPETSASPDRGDSTWTRARTIRTVSAGRYEVDMSGPGGDVTHTFDVITEPSPAVVWSDAFEDGIGSSNRSGQAILAAVLEFHRLAQLDFRTRKP